MLGWREFEQVAPQIAEVGERLLYREKSGEVAILATIDGDGRPCVAPICPIFSDSGLYLLAAARTPKVRHLVARPTFALHALVGADDLEFQISGAACVVVEEEERAAVIADVPFSSFDPTDPIFELTFDRALAVVWPSVDVRQVLRWAL